MAKSDSDSNGLRQDQPECPLQSRGVRREHTRYECDLDRYRHLASGDTRSQTECHRTTRANIRSHLYGGPQGWNPHLLRTSVYAERVHNPFDITVVRAVGFRRPRPGRACNPSECPVTLKGVGSIPAETARREWDGWSAVDRTTRTTDDTSRGPARACAPRRFVLFPMGVIHLRPSNRTPPRHAISWETATRAGGGQRPLPLGRLRRAAWLVEWRVAWQEGGQSSRASRARCGRVGATRLSLGTAGLCSSRTPADGERRTRRSEPVQRRRKSSRGPVRSRLKYRRGARRPVWRRWPS